MPVPACNLGFSVAFDQRRLFTSGMRETHMPSSRHPLYDALKTFEAAGLHFSFTRAGGCGPTRAAISHQVGNSRSVRAHATSIAGVPWSAAHGIPAARSWRIVPPFHHHGGMSSLSLFMRLANEGRAGRWVLSASRRISSRTVFLKSMAILPVTDVSEPCPVPACSLRRAEDT